MYSICISPIDPKHLSAHVLSYFDLVAIALRNGQYNILKNRHHPAMGIVDQGVITEIIENMMTTNSPNFLKNIVDS